MLFAIKISHRQLLLVNTNVTVDEEWQERLHILDDARKLKQLAEYFMHPEKTVKNDRTATARCFFDRPSAPDRVSEEEAEEQARIFEDLKALKKLAIDYMHPEMPVVTTDPTATARCFFDRPSAGRTYFGRGSRGAGPHPC
jgi:hypothetical protein